MAYVSSGERLGIAKGIELGMQQGMQQGEASALQRLLSKRFGAIPTAISTLIGAANLAQIELWFDRAIDARDLAAIFGDDTPSAH